LKRRDLSDDLEEAGLARNWKTSERVERAGKKLKRKDCGENEETGDFLSTSNNARRRSIYYLPMGRNRKNRLQNKINKSYRSWQMSD
jgi:hypothetical protein